jgi:hypothetical protein
MAKYKLFPIADTTLYSGFPEKNTGIDEILEASTTFLTQSLFIVQQYPQTSRFLVRFDQEELENIIQTKVSSSTWKAVLKCYNAEAYGLTDTAKVLVNPIAEQWSMGTGKLNSEPQVKNGASWVYKNYGGGIPWTTGSFPTGTTGSFNLDTNPQSAGGGTWYTSPEYSQSFDYYSPLDLEIDITPTVRQWISSSLPNYGLILRQQPSQEFIDNKNVQTSLKYFSRDTHTIYVPQLEICWEDNTYSTGSLPELDKNPATITVTNNIGQYYLNTENIFYIGARPTYPDRQWSTGSVYTKNYRLPEGSTYALQDVDSRDFIIDFDDQYTKISCDGTSNYFKIYMNGLEPERYYRILVKANINNSVTVLEGGIFKVINS